MSNVESSLFTAADVKRGAFIIVYGSGSDGRIGYTGLRTIPYGGYRLFGATIFFM